MAWKDYDNTFISGDETSVTGKGTNFLLRGLVLRLASSLWVSFPRSGLEASQGQSSSRTDLNQVSASFFCVQSPGPARAGGRPYQLRWCSGGAQAVANYLCRSRRTHSNYLCRSRWPGVHTQLQIIYVRGGLPRPHIAGPSPRPLLLNGIFTQF